MCRLNNEIWDIKLSPHLLTERLITFASFSQGTCVVQVEDLNVALHFFWLCKSFYYYYCTYAKIV